MSVGAGEETERPNRLIDFFCNTTIKPLHGLTEQALKSIDITRPGLSHRINLPQHAVNDEGDDEHDDTESDHHGEHWTKPRAHQALGCRRDQNRPKKRDNDGDQNEPPSASAVTMIAMINN